jgi:hypothetical protein
MRLGLVVLQVGLAKLQGVLRLLKLLNRLVLVFGCLQTVGTEFGLHQCRLGGIGRGLVRRLDGLEQILRESVKKRIIRNKASEGTSGSIRRTASLHCTALFATHRNGLLRLLLRLLQQGQFAILRLVGGLQGTNLNLGLF